MAMSNLTLRFSISSSLAECFARAVGFPGSGKPLAVIRTSSVFGSEGLIGLGGSTPKGSTILCSAEVQDSLVADHQQVPPGIARRLQILVLAFPVHESWGLLLACLF